MIKIILYSLFVMKYDPNLPTELHPYLLFPINSDLKISLKQRGGGAAPCERSLVSIETHTLISSS